jgi:hypothetical protein
MAWDPALLRKFNATGHFRLLNQVRSELKANPIKRAAPTAADQASSRGPATGKPLDLRSQGYGRRRSSGSSSASASASAAPSVAYGASTSPAPTAGPLPVAPLAESFASPASSPSPWGRSSSASVALADNPSSPETALAAERNTQAEAGTTPEAGSRSFRDRLNAIQMR